jgi:tRNA (adenine-N(1)-)-methyltransferase non-catalytic subunit
MHVMTDTSTTPLQPPAEQVTGAVPVPVPVQVPVPVADAFLTLPSPTVKDGEFVLLIFGDERQIFAQALTRWRGKSPPLKINKRSYSTAHLVGMDYGTVCELDLKRGLIPLPEGQDIIPDAASTSADLDLVVSKECDHDNRNLVDDNKSQTITQQELADMRSDPSIHGKDIVATIIQNSATFEAKTSFSKAKYVRRKQIKYQPRCRIVRCTASTICQALYLKDARKLQNLRHDSLAQVLSFANISAGQKVLMVDQCLGLVTGACAQRMGGYGSILSIYTGQAPPHLDFISRFNLNYMEHSSIKWLHSGDVFGNDQKTENQDAISIDYEANERKQVKWPCPLQEHTQKYVEGMENDEYRKAFLAKRSSRFARKLTRPSLDETKAYLIGAERKCDSIILACKYDPTSTLLALLPYLETSSPFVVFYEFLEPLLECFRELQDKKLAINLRLSDTWMREYQVLPGRTHPNMHMSQNGGFILTGIKLCPTFGKNELDDDLIKEIRAEIGGRRGKKKRSSGDNIAGGRKKKR